MRARRLRRRLRRITGTNAFLSDSASCAVYGYDSSLQTARPDFVLFPRTTTQVAEIVRVLHNENVPYVARGAGTNLSGGSIPSSGGAVIALTRMKGILSIEPENFCAHVEAGLTNLEFQEALASRGYFFAPDPASQQVCTLGGNVAENSGGPHCVKYGVTTHHVLGATVVAPDGEIMRLGGRTLDRPGYDVLGLLVGSEGTLGIVTEILCRILPLPESTQTMLAIFDSMERAGQTVSDIIAAGIIPATLEMMDNLVIRAVEESLRAGYPTDAAAVLIIEIDGKAEGLTDAGKEIEDICRANEVRELRAARSEDERNQLWAGRRGAFGAVARLYPNYSVSDGTVPRAQLPQALRRIEKIAGKYGLDIGNVFHAGEGNLHPLVFFDARDTEQLGRVHKAGEEILEACAELGGTITGEHGVGTEKIHAMPLVFGAGEIEVMHRIKNTFDPKNLCNPGKILPQSEREPDYPSVSDLDKTHAPLLSSKSVRGMPTYVPSTMAELSATVRHLIGEGKSLDIVGGGTLFPRLPMRTSADACVRTTGMRQIVEHDVDNLSVTAQAGLSVAELQEQLAQGGQFAPLDAPPHATLGGVVATALAGPRRHFYGAPRDLVLGLQFVNAAGTALHAGGKTVKNVAGYDFGKLLVGSWGTLGILSEITLRLLPVPRMCGAVAAGFENIEDACNSAFRAASGLEPTVTTLMNTRAATRLSAEVRVAVSPHPYVLILGAEGFPGAVRSQVASFLRICEERRGEILGQVEHDDYRILVDGLPRLCYGIDESDSAIHVCVRAPCETIPEILVRIDELGFERAMDSSVIAHLASGTVYARCPVEEADGLRGHVKTVIEAVRCLSPDLNIVVMNVCREAAAEVPLMVGGNTARKWLAAVKQCLDPHGRMNPGIPNWW